MSNTDKDRKLEQTWQLSDDNDLIYFDPTFSNHCIEVTNDNIKDGSTLTLNRCEITVAGQLFDTSGLRDLLPASQIKVKNSNLPYCFTAPSLSNKSQFVTLEQCRSLNEFGVSSEQGVDIAKRQQWKADGDKIRNVETGLCLTALNSLNSFDANNLNTNYSIQSNVIGTNIITGPCL